MQEAIPYRTWTAPPLSAARDGISTSSGDGEEARGAGEAVLRNAVVVFGRNGCCMCHVARRLFLGHGVNPAVFEVNEKDEAAVLEELTKIAAPVNGGDGCRSTLTTLQFPVVFVGGKMFGGLEKVMAAHISGDLVPILRDAGALWL